jgi:cellulose synthase/poly-beta-1,6-N-acetylglucosamine synthase-like glycosyltransferase
MNELLYVVGLIITGVYALSLVYITLYCLLQLHLLWSYSSYHIQGKDKITCQSHTDGIKLPYVTIQLPIYNEKYVVERLINQVCQLNYPSARFEIQILDDSTDETSEIVQKSVQHHSAKGVQIYQIRRGNRSGFKAGALKAGMLKAKGEYIAIFDADFMPHPDFLRETLPYFSDKKVGVVQTRWEHLNENFSLITRLQAFQLNVHFTVEQMGRQAADFLLQFNGTAGVWRKETIDDAGGWEADTLTEDLDLSYRAQIKGWKIKFLESVGSPAELPAEMNGLKSQQYRWMKGGAETARKVLPDVWSSSIPLRKKIHATGHLLASAVFVFVFMAGVLSVPTLMAIDFFSWNASFLTVFLIGLLSIAAVYFVANARKNPSNPNPGFYNTIKFLILFPIFLALSMGLSLHNSIAVIQGFIGRKTPFIRTPKYNILSGNDSFKRKKYVGGRLSWTTLGEGMLSLYFLFGLVYGFYNDNNTFLVYHLLLALGFGTIFYYSLRHLSIK